MGIQMQLNKINIGKRIKEIRKSGSWTLEEFGELIFKASKGTVSHWEKGSYLPNKERIKQIANIGNVSLNWLMYGDVRDYLEELFPREFLEDFNEEFHLQLEKKMKSEEIAYDDYGKILSLAIEVNPELIKKDEFREKYIDNTKKANYDLEEMGFYRDIFLPKLHELFIDSESTTGLRNRLVIQIIMDDLLALNDEEKAKFLSLITSMSLALKPMRDKNKETCIKEYEKYKEEVVRNLDSIFKIKLNSNE